MGMLDRLYTALDALSAAHGVFKIDTIGDAYLVAANLSGDQVA
jgi:class 3 adenylate cyclase